MPSWTHQDLMKNLQGLSPEKRDDAKIIASFYEKNRWGNRAPSEDEKRKILLAIEKI